MPNANIVEKKHKFYGYKMIQNPSNEKFALYVGAADATILKNIVSVDNAVQWDKASGNWCVGGRNRTVLEAHWMSILKFLETNSSVRILPSSIIISVNQMGFEFNQFPEIEELNRSVPGTINLTGRYYSNVETGEDEPVDEKDRYAWVLDGQHRIRAFRDWNSPDPYPINIVVIKQWAGPDYEDSMRHQTYEMNMGRPLDNNFKASIRERYNSQVGHPSYKKEIALSWIRADLERRGKVFTSDGVTGGTNLRTPYLIQMHTLEKIILEAHRTDPYLYDQFNLESLSVEESKKIGEYLFNFFEGVRLSIGLIHSSHRAMIETFPANRDIDNYWDLALHSPGLAKQQHIVHNVGLRSIMIGLLENVMAGSVPESPQEVAAKLSHMKGIPWYDGTLRSKKDDWVSSIAKGLKKMYATSGTNNPSKMYNLQIKKSLPDGTDDTFKLQCLGF